jgi:phage protein D
VPTVNYSLTIGGSPADADLLGTVQQLEVEDSAGMAGILRLKVAVAVGAGGSDWDVIDDGLFQRLTEIKVGVTLGSLSETLLTADVIETNADFSNRPGQSVLNVVAMDPSVRMNLEEKIRQWPNMSDGDIASRIFEEYGFSPEVDSTTPSRTETETTVIQRGTDIQFLRQLARRNGFECYVESNPRSGGLEGHFHAPRLDQEELETLSVNLGEATNVNSFRARYDMLRPTTVQVTGLDIESQSDQIAQADSVAQTGLGRTSALPGSRPRVVLASRMGLAQTGELQTYAQAVVDRSAWAVSAEGELNTASYGAILRARRPVPVRGAGRQFSGVYYVEKVLHTFTGDGYIQRFTLRRNATGLQGSEDFTPENAAS